MTFLKGNANYLSANLNKDLMCTQPRDEEKEFPMNIFWLLKQSITTHL